MSCKVLVTMWALVVVAAAMSVKIPPGTPGHGSGEPILRPGRRGVSFVSGDHQSGKARKQQMHVPSGKLNAYKMPSFRSAAITTGSDYLEALGIERNAALPKPLGRKFQGEVGASPVEAQSDKFALKDVSSAFDAMGMEESASAPRKRRDAKSSSPSQRCCMPSQFEAMLASHIGAVDGKKPPQSGLSLVVLSYDYTNKKLHLMYPDMQGDVYRILIDFSKKPPVSYTMMADGKCHCDRMWGEMVPWCTPVSARLARGLSLTGSGDDVNMFISTESPVSMTLTRKSDCVFLMTSRTAGNAGTEYASMTVTTFMNVTMGISNPDVMTIPQGCKRASKA